MKKVSSPHIETLLKKLPTTPGVYQMKDSTGQVIYVGKAKNLKSRVRSYFDRMGELTLAKKQMVAKISDIETIICQTEVEALVLETNLIKHLTPKYNILMKDDKNLAYIKITNSPVPELIKTRKKIKDGGEYYGPYVAGVESSVRALRRIYKIRDCRIKFSRKQSGELIITDRAGRTPPCMDYYIGLCPAPCLLTRETVDGHASHIDQVRKYLKGQGGEVIEMLEAEMRDKARNLQFEEAQKLKETLDGIKIIHERQKVRDIVEGDIDIFLKYEKYDKTYIVLTQVRSSQIIGVFRYEVEPGVDGDVMVSFLSRHYIDSDDHPDTLLLTEEISDDVFLQFLQTERIQVEYPQIGPKKSLIDFSLNQIREYAYKKEMSALENKTLSREHMVRILQELGYPAPAKGEIVFECYDISHTDGHFTYASRVTLANGQPDTSRYKRYKIKSLQSGTIDDFASHREVMYRRGLEGIELGNFPHLIIIDGGKGQLSHALEGLTAAYVSTEQQMHELPLSSIAKREEEIFIPGKKDPIIFKKGTPELMVLQKARDESHRFSLGANIAARTKSMKKNILEQIPGIGPTTRKKLMRLAGDLESLYTLEKEVLLSVCTRPQILTLQEHGLISPDLEV